MIAKMVCFDTSSVHRTLRRHTPLLIRPFKPRGGYIFLTELVSVQPNAPKARPRL
jgi:hypothetical protein